MTKILMPSCRLRTLTPIVVENGVVTSIMLTMAHLQIGAPAAGAVPPSQLVLRAMLAAVAVQLCLHWRERRQSAAERENTDRVVRLISDLGVASLVLALSYLSFPSLRLAGSIFIPSAVLLVCVLPAWEIASEWLVDRVGATERLLFVGTRPATLALAAELAERRRELGVEIVGFVEPDREVGPARLPYPGLIGGMADIPHIVRTNRVTRVVVNVADARGTLPMDDLLAMRLEGVTFDYLASVYEEYTGKIALENLRPSWFVFSPGFRKSAVVRMVKRTSDVVVSGLMLLLLAPVIALVALAVRMSSGSPVLFLQTRTGQYGRPFTIYKFRTMRRDAEANGARWASTDDPRVTSIGAVLRRYRLDELPQLWNVLRGDMSLVGPRPERPEFVGGLTERIPFYGQRHVVKPGLTGWAQVRYSYASSIEDTMQKLQYELFYIKNMSLALDAFILAATVRTVLRGEGGR